MKVDDNVRKPRPSLKLLWTVIDFTGVETKHFDAEREGFEPSLPCGKHAFQACSIGHSDTSPKNARKEMDKF